MKAPTKRGPKKRAAWKPFVIYSGDIPQTTIGWRIYQEQLPAMVERMAEGMSCLPHGKHMTRSWWAAYKRDYPDAWKCALIATDAALRSIGLSVPRSPTSAAGKGERL